MLHRSEALVAMMVRFSSASLRQCFLNICRFPLAGFGVVRHLHHREASVTGTAS
jgi:hypothetical protein